MDKAAWTKKGVRAQREQTEQRLRLTLLRFFAVAVMLRHTCELIAAHGGSAGWWLAIVCMLPGLGVYSLLCAALKKSGCISMPEMLRRLLGKAGYCVVQSVTGIALLLEGAASLSALATVFVDGVGTTVSAFLFAVVAAVVLCLCMQREGLLFGVGLLRWVLAAFAMLVALNMLAQARMDHLFPYGGDGPASWLQAVRSSWSLGWPVVLLLWEQHDENHKRGWLIPPVIVAAAAVVLCLALPHETLTQPRTLAERMLLPGLSLEPGNRVLLMCLWTAGLGLASVISAVRAADLFPFGSDKWKRWLPCGLLMLYAAMQLIGLDAAETILNAAADWLLMPFTLLAAVMLPLAMSGRKRK